MTTSSLISARPGSQLNTRSEVGSATPPVVWDSFISVRLVDAARAIEDELPTTSSGSGDWGIETIGPAPSPGGDPNY